MIYAKPFQWQEANPLVITALLDAFVAHPEFLTYPHQPEVARRVGASLLTDENNLLWASYDKQDLTGLIVLTRVVPRVDALFHFFFLDQNLSGKRKLLRNILGLCLTDLGFNRISMEVPDREGKGKPTRLERFARKALGFRLEGEIRDRNPELPMSLTDDWVARQGSRREQAYYDGSAWSDVVLLRVLAREWVDGEQGGSACLYQPEQQPSQPLSSEPEPVPSSEAAAPVTPSPSSPETSSPSDSRI